MCTLIVDHRPESERLIVGANRNEHYDRPSSPPEWRLDREVPIFAPRDERSGGTWIGLNAEGLFAGLTNRFGHPPDPDRRSRGELIPRVLDSDSVDEAASTLESFEASNYNPFHLIVAHRQAGWLVVSNGERMSLSPLESGLTVITERSFGAADARRKVNVRRQCLEHLDARDELDEAALRSVLSTCDAGSMDAVCVDIPEMNYGTKSSTLFRSTSDDTRYRHAEGPPCEVDYEDCSPSLAEHLEGD